MKKVVFVLIVFVCYLGSIEATSVPKIVNVVNKCSVVDNKIVVIPVKVMVTNEGVLTSIINEYTLGKIENDKDNMIIKVNNIIGNNITKVVLDYNRDSDNKSYIKYYLEDDIKLNSLDNLVNFNIEIEFIEDVPDNIYILGNEVILSEEEKICEAINEVKITEVEKIVNEAADNTKLYVIIGVLVISLGVLIVMFIKRNK